MTAALAYSASTRALGGSLAVRMLPMFVTAQAVGAAASVSVLILGIAALVIWGVQGTAVTTPGSDNRLTAAFQRF
jgi:hypothetical protein